MSEVETNTIAVTQSPRGTSPAYPSITAWDPASGWTHGFGTDSCAQVNQKDPLCGVRGLAWEAEGLEWAMQPRQRLWSPACLFLQSQRALRSLPSLITESLSDTLLSL